MPLHTSITAKLKKTSKTSFWQGRRTTGILILVVGLYNVTTTLESNVAVFKNLKAYLPYDQHSTRRYLHKRNERICSYKDV